MTPPKLKICGITSKEQGITIAQMGADALGFILFPKSPRYLKPEDIKQIVFDLPPFVKTVGVFVNETVDTVGTIMKTTGLDLVQLSGDESKDYCASLTHLSIPWIKGFRVKDQASIDQLSSFRNRYLLLDAWSDDEYGGTGRVFDWNLLNNGTIDKRKLVLAGGINASNVRRAIDHFHPYAIDISSSVEERPGVKSIEKVEKFMAAMRA